ncbi:MAG: efflux RND transporter periplasmic adaptor subunit [Victivallales bacterium]
MIAQAKPLKSVNLVARVSGFLEQRNFIEGSYVKQGTLLYLIEQKPYEIALKKSPSSLGIAQARAENARLNFMRVSELYREKVAPPQKFDSARASKQEGDAELLGGEAQLAQAELNLSYTKITAPFNGWIGLSSYDVGNYISTPSRPLAQLMYIDSMRIEFNVSDSYLTPEMRSRLQDGKAPGLRVTLLEEDGSVYPHEGKITFWNNTINRQTATLQVQALFPRTGNTVSCPDSSSGYASPGKSRSRSSSRTNFPSARIRPGILFMSSGKTAGRNSSASGPAQTPMKNRRSSRKGSPREKRPSFRAVRC